MKLNNKFRKFLTSAAVPLLFIFISSIAIPFSKYSGEYIIREIVTRLSRDSFLVLSLLLPVMAGMGINFGMVLGAMAGQMALIFITDWGIGGAPGLVLGMLLSVPISMILGYMGGKILNRAKGREMITSMIMGLFFAGINQFVLLYLCGSLIKMKNPVLVLSKGYGIRNAISLNTTRGFDNLINLKIGIVSIPIGTILITVAICFFIVWFRKTKIGQDMKAVGQDMLVSDMAGIKVEKTRIQAIIISTVLAGFGQIIYLQNIGTVNTYNGVDSVALYAAAALLVGGATVSRASIPNAVLGTGIFHLMFFVMAKAGANITGSGMLGEYLRMFISYGVVTVALILHSWKRQKDKEMDRAVLRQAGTPTKP